MTTSGSRENFKSLPYDPTKLPRELTEYYISSSKEEQTQMLATLKLKDLKDLFSHIPDNVKFDKAPFVCEELSYNDLIAHVNTLASKNNLKTCFIGDGLKNYKVHELVPFVCNLRGLTTAYTPYQPERSQGTLQTLWIYSSAISMLTGFEAINASFYDRSTTLFEAIQTATRITKNARTALVCESIYPGDIEVLKTYAKETDLKLIFIPTDKETGITNIDTVSHMAGEIGKDLACIAFPQVNNFGNLEDIHSLTDLCSELKIQSIAIIDPILLATEGLIPPVEFGSQKQGCNMIVGEGQHLAIGPNFGGPGLGIFGIRYNNSNKLDIRQTAGRFVGRAKDLNGKEALCMVLSTREQHIRREKATSNICSNQSFVASAAGAGILARGEQGMTDAALIGKDYAQQMAQILTQFKGVKLAFESTPFFNEFTLEIPGSVKELQKKAGAAGLQLGVDVSGRIQGDNRNLLLLSFFDVHTDEDLEKLENFFTSNFESLENDEFLPEIPENFLRTTPVGLPSFETEELKVFYKKLADLNVSPDDNIYPLGSCTMKYNPYINDYAASLKGFTDVHPQAPVEDIQGSLEILYGIQEMFKSITGLPAVTTQPVAGAQGELVGLKLFQAYHRNNGEAETRNILLIPRSAHGTNPATATMAGFETKTLDGVQYGIVVIEADNRGHIDFTQLKNEITKYNTRIAGVMVTNPNTSGLFETCFKEMSELIHGVGGLVYMDGANMNAIAGWIDLDKMGVDAVHNNLHKTWTIPHGGGGPGDGIVAVSNKLIDYLPGIQVTKAGDKFDIVRAPKSIGSFHRHVGNFAHKVRAYTYIKALGGKGTREMSGVAVLAARYLFEKLKPKFPSLPENAEAEVRMHEFILTISKDTFDRIEKGGTPKAQSIAKIGKLFLDFGLHAPTVAFPEIYGLMIEPTETYSKVELDRFVEVVTAIEGLINETPHVLTTAPHFTPVKKIDEVDANKNLLFTEQLKHLPHLYENVIDPIKLSKMDIKEVCKDILLAHKKTARP
jgi:glycine dehydrogenase